METVRYLRALLRSWWLIVITLIAGGVGGFLVYHHATPMYRASTRLVVKLNSSGLDAASARTLAGVQAQALAQVAGTPPAEQDAFEAAGTSGSSPTVTARASTDDPFIAISVEDRDAGATAAIANAYQSTLAASAERLVGRSSTPYTLNVVSPAAKPSSPYSPDLLRDLAFGLAAGLVLGVAIAVLREMFNRTVRESEALHELTGLTVLGTVPRDMPKKLLPAMSDPRSARAEAYRQIRTTLLNRTTQRPLTLAVTSAALGDGKTSVACNVAAIFSRAGHRVALIDADLRRPKVATFFDLRPEAGLSEVLMGIATLDDALVMLDDRLTVVTAGRIPQDPSELLGSERMADIIKRLSDECEFVIIDTPPVLPVTDALVLAPLVDGIVIVSRLGGTTAERITRALSAIDRVQANIIGIVPNQAAVGADRDYRYSYRYTPARRRGSDGGDTSVTPADSRSARAQPRTRPANVDSGDLDLPWETGESAANPGDRRGSGR